MKIIVASRIIPFLSISTHAAEGTTIRVSELNAQFLPLGFAENAASSKSDLHAEIVRINPTFDSQRCAKAAWNRLEIKISRIGSNVVEEDG